MDSIFLEQIKVQTKLGVPEWERLLPQTVLLDIEMDCDLAQACRSDTLKDTLDYAAVVARIRASLAQTNFQLIEALAEHVCQLILTEFPATAVRVKAAKPAILPGVKALGVTIARQK